MDAGDLGAQSREAQSHPLKRPRQQPQPEQPDLEQSRQGSKELMGASKARTLQKQEGGAAANPGPAPRVAARRGSGSEATSNEASSSEASSSEASSGPATRSRCCGQGTHSHGG